MELSKSKAQKKEATPEQMRDLLHRCAIFADHFGGMDVSITSLPKIVKGVMEFNKTMDLKQLFTDLQQFK